MLNETQIFVCSLSHTPLFLCTNRPWTNCTIYSWMKYLVDELSYDRFFGPGRNVPSFSVDDLLVGESSVDVMSSGRINQLPLFWVNSC